MVEVDSSYLRLSPENLSIVRVEVWTTSRGCQSAGNPLLGIRPCGSGSLTLGERRRANRVYRGDPMEARPSAPSPEVQSLEQLTKSAS